MSKQTGTLSQVVQKIDFLEPHFGGFPVELPQKTSGEKIAFAAQQLYRKIRFRCFCGLGEEKRTKIKKKKKDKKGKKKKKTSSRPKVDWLGQKSIVRHTTI